MTTVEVQTTEIDDCWNRIGVAGDQSCKKLTVHIHCRNCELYAGAAQRNLQRPVDDDYKKEWAVHFRRARSDASKNDTSVLAFRIGLEWLALPTRICVAVAPQASPHVLPHRSNANLLGIVNVGGKLYPCMSLAALLGVDEREQPAPGRRHIFPRLLLIEWQEQVFALPVADLDGIIRYAGSALRVPAATINVGLVPYLAGLITHQGKHIACLDAALIGEQLARALR